MTTIQVELQRSNTTTRQMYTIEAKRIVGHLAIHKRVSVDSAANIHYGNDYVITHLPSGRILFTWPKYKPLNIALDTISELNIDWSLSNPFTNMNQDARNQLANIRLQFYTS